MNEDIFWRAVKNCDGRFDGIFFTCVKSTGIYCKPSCPARLPKRENVFFVDSVHRAESKGFRSCLRCKPKDTGVVDMQVERVVRACAILRDENELSLSELSREVGLSPAHFQRTFKKLIGVSPKKFAEQTRIENFKNELKNGSEVTEAMYEAGYGSSSRLYENSGKNLGMTPGTYKKGGAGMKIEFTIAGSELGRMLVARTNKGICSVKFGDTDEDLIEDLNAEFENARIQKDRTNLSDSVRQILAHLEKGTSALELPLDVRATAFQMRVWQELRKIPYGETRSYKEVAEKIGKPKAVRAVASACAKNQVALVIPCHRVIGSDGRLSGYRWGTERKQQLLEKEKQTVKD